MKKLTLAIALSLMAAPAHATLLDAIYYFSLGSIVMGECPAEGYKVDGNAWHALAGHAYDDIAKDGYYPGLFMTGGKYEKPSIVSLHSIGSLSDAIGHDRFCAGIRDWAVTTHPIIGHQLISR